MAAINDLIARIQDPDLRQRIEKEVKELTKQKKFGLVFENHIPEMTLLYDYPISRGCKVIRKSDDDKKLSEYLQQIITQYFIGNKSEIWSLSLSPVCSFLCSMYLICLVHGFICE